MTIDGPHISVQEAIKLCALAAILKGRVNKYKPFRSAEQTYLKTRGDNARIQAELTGNLADNFTLRCAQAILKSAIKHAKRDCFKNFAAKLDFRKDGIRAHRYLSALNNKHCSVKNESLISHCRQFTTNNKKALALTKHSVSVCRLSSSRKDSRPQAGCLKHDEDMLFYSDFTSDELQKAMKETISGNSAGHNDLPAAFFLHFGKSAERTLLHFF